MLEIFFNSNNLMVFLFVAFIQILGLNFFLLFFKNFFKKNNLFLNLSYSWFFGNVIFSFLIFFFFVFKKLNFLNLNSLIPATCCGVTTKGVVKGNTP